MITLHIYLHVKHGRELDLEQLYRESYVPSITIQRGFRSSTLLKSYDKQIADEIASTHEWSYEIDIAFDTEANRRAWASGPEHTEAWPKIEAMCDRISWKGFDVLA